MLLQTLLLITFILAGIIVHFPEHCPVFLADYPKTIATITTIYNIVTFAAVVYNIGNLFP